MVSEIFKIKFIQSRLKFAYSAKNSPKSAFKALYFPNFMGITLFVMVKFVNETSLKSFSNEIKSQTFSCL
jgi:hypothetical protein